MCSMLAVDSWHKAIGACKFVVAYFLDLEKVNDYINCNNCFRYVRTLIEQSVKQADFNSSEL